VATAFLLQTLGLERSTATNTGLITGLFVVVAPVANRLLFGVRTRCVLWAAIGASLVGLGLLTGAAPQGIAAGDWITARAAVLFGLHVALLDRYSKHHQATVLAFGQLLGATLLLVAFWLLLAMLGPSVAPLEWPPAKVWPALLITGVLASAAAFFVQTFVQKRLSAVETAMIMGLEPIFAAVFGYLLHGDRLTAVQLMGAVVMIAAVFMVELYPLLRKRSPSHTPNG
jgi:drug/metabolite transporter (DMT)-like permease